MAQQEAVFEGIRVLDLTRLAPGPYCTMLLADMGADVVVVGGGRGGLPIDAYRRGKRFVQIDLKSDAGVDAFRALSAQSDVLVEGFRPGVCERLGIGYEDLRRSNPGLVYCSLTGYGQDGPLSQEAGHDINYVGLSGALGAFGPPDDVPTVPLNLLADFAGGGLYAAYAIAGALFERERSGEGQYIDVAMVDGCISLMAMHYPDWGKPVLPGRGKGLLAGEAPFYRCYTCADDKHVAVGALESAFFGNLWSGLGFDETPPDHMNRSIWPEMTARFKRRFLERDRDAWVEHFAGTNACVSPVLSPGEVFDHPQNRSRNPDSSRDSPPLIPRYSRSHGKVCEAEKKDDSEAVLRSAGLSQSAIAQAVPEGRSSKPGGLVWPPVTE